MPLSAHTRTPTTRSTPISKLKHDRQIGRIGVIVAVEIGRATGGPTCKHSSQIISIDYAIAVDVGNSRFASVWNAIAVSVGRQWIRCDALHISAEVIHNIQLTLRIFADACHAADGRKLGGSSQQCEPQQDDRHFRSANYLKNMCKKTTRRSLQSVWFQ